MHKKMKQSTKITTTILLFSTLITLTRASCTTCKISPARMLLASSIIKKMDFTVNPCDNFYQFACGRFIKETIIPDNRTSAGIFEDLDAKVEYQLSLIIPDGIKEDSPPVFKSMKHYYQTCMDTDEIEKNSVKNLQEVLKKLGGCPVLEGQSWDETNFDWKRAILESSKMGYLSDFVFRTSITTDPDNSSRAIINIEQANTDLPHESLIKGKNYIIVQKHLQALIKIYELLGIDKKIAEEEIGSALDLEIDLAKISLSYEERKDKSKLNNRMTLQQLETNYRSIEWTEFLNEILAPYVQINQSEEINVAVPNFLKSLFELIERTSKRVLANYVCIRTIWESIDNMGERFLSIKTKDLRNYSAFVKNDNPRWQYCLAKISDHFPTAVGWLYVKNYFDKDTKANAVRLVEKLKSTLVSYIEQSDWIDGFRKYNATSKVKAIASHIGYPDEFDMDEKINEAYQNWTLSTQNFFNCELTLKQFQKKETHSSLRKPVNKTNWIEHGRGVATVNAYYTSQYNSFDLPAGILQGELFSKDRPNYMNYATIGSFVGHEMAHAFDNQGSQYDKDGNLGNWLGNVTRERFLEIAQCIIDQYSNYTVKEVNMKINGMKTLNENFADNIGLRAAHRAYHLWLTEEYLSFEDRLPGLQNYTDQQMFWITFANAWCTKYEPNYLRMGVSSDVHSPSEFRVIGTLSNMKYFSNDFNCPLGSPMNPVKKCTLD